MRWNLVIGLHRTPHPINRWRRPGTANRWQFLLLLLRPGSPSPTAFALPSRWHPLPGAVETNAPPSESPWSLQDFALRAVNPGLWWRWGDSNPRPTPTYFNLQGLSAHTTISLRADESPQCSANHQEMMLLASRYAPLATLRTGSGIRARPAPTLDGGALRAPVGVEADVPHDSGRFREGVSAHGACFCFPQQITSGRTSGSTPTRAFASCGSPRCAGSPKRS